jgi:regulator of ribonuclease activity B
LCAEAFHRAGSALREKGDGHMTLWVICTIVAIVVCVLALKLRKARLAQSPADADGIDRPMKAGSNLSQVYPIEFLFSFPARAAAEGASARLHMDGYTVSMDGTAMGTRCVLRATRSMIPSLSELQVLRSTLNDLAAREGGLYNGWKAEALR